MKYLLFMMLLTATSRAWPCSCFGTSSIGETIAAYPNLIEAQVVSASRYEATLRVERVLKGRVSSNTIVIAQSMCYRSLDVSMMNPRHTYVVPLGEPAQNPEALISPSDSPEGKYELPGCAESGLELVGGQLYTFEPTTGLNSEPKHYADYAHFVRWLSVSEVLAITGLYMERALEILAERAGPVASLTLLGFCVALVVVFARLSRDRRRQMIALVVTLPAIWLLIGLWGSIVYNAASKTDSSTFELGWQSIPPSVGMIAFFSFAAIYIRRVAVARVFAVGYSLINGYFSVMMCLFSLMATNARLPSPSM